MAASRISTDHRFVLVIPKLVIPKLLILLLLLPGCSSQDGAARSPISSKSSSSELTEAQSPDEAEEASSGDASDDPIAGLKLAELTIPEENSADAVVLPSIPKRKQAVGGTSPYRSPTEQNRGDKEDVASSEHEMAESYAFDDIPLTIPTASDPGAGQAASGSAASGSSAGSGVPSPPPIPRPAGAAPQQSNSNSTSSAVSSGAGSGSASAGGSVEGGSTIRRKGLSYENKGYSAERVYFATNREPATTKESQGDPDLFFSDVHGDLSYGTCQISIPYKRAPGSLPSPSVLKLEFSQDPQKHVVLMEIERLPDAAFWIQLRSRVESSPDKQLMLFVHGYCATFRDAARRTAQMAYDMNYQGPAMFFSWPAGGEEEGFQERANYLKDLRRAEESDEDLITVIENIGRFSGAERVHLVAHSMGNFVLTEALKTIDDRLGQGTQRPQFFDQVVMAAPDINAKDFVRMTGRRVRPFSRRFTVYASKQDKALRLSKSVNGFEPLGLLNDHSRSGAQSRLYELVDASTSESSWFDSGHVYYGDMPEMLRDLAFVFRGVAASSLQRGLGETPPLFRLTSRSTDTR